MGALFEFLAELVVAVTIAVFAQLGVSLSADEGRAGPQPSIERTVVRTAPHVAEAVSQRDCDEAPRLRSA